MPQNEMAGSITYGQKRYLKQLVDERNSHDAPWFNELKHDRERNTTVYPLHKHPTTFKRSRRIPTKSVSLPNPVMRTRTLQGGHPDR